MRLVGPEVKNMQASPAGFDNIIFVIAITNTVDDFLRQFLPAPVARDKFEEGSIFFQAVFGRHPQNEIGLPVANFAVHLPFYITDGLLPAVEVASHKQRLILPVQIGIIGRPKNKFYIGPVDKITRPTPVDKGRQLPQ